MRVALGVALVSGAGSIAGGVAGMVPAGRADAPVVVLPVVAPPPAMAAPVSASARLAGAYAAARQAVAIRFPHAAGTIRLTATLWPDGEIARLDARGDGLDVAVLGTVSQIVTASGVAFPAGTASADLPPLTVGAMAAPTR